jgi:GNAT superfamily N-acetyltransferase
MNQVDITRASILDAPAILPLLSVQLEEHGMGMPHDVLEEALRGILTRPERGMVLLARESGRAVGIAVLPYTWTVEHGGLCAWLDELYVVPEMRSKGIGTRLLETALDLACKEGCFAIDLEVDADHSRVESLYLRHGFRALPRRRFSRRVQ